MKLTNKIPLLVSIPLVICFILLGLLNYNSSKNDAVNYSNLGKQKTLEATMLYVDSYFSGKMNFLTKFAKAIEEVNIDTDEDMILRRLNLLYSPSGLNALYFAKVKDGKTFYKGNEEAAHIIKDFDARERNWFKEALVDKVVNLSDDIYYDDRLKTVIATIYAPVMQNGKIIGVIGGDLTLKPLKDSVLKLKYSATNAIFAFDTHNQFTLHINPKYELKQNPVIDTIKQELSKAQDYNGFKTIEYNFENHDKNAVCTTYDKLNWTICSTNENKDFDENLNNLLKQNLTMFIISLLIISAILYLLIKQSLRPLEIIQKGLKEVFALINHERKTASKIDLNSKDEFGDMAKAINENIERTI
ncbi:cache domain-containing protein, partial [Campylobacter sp. RM9334]|uniref:HAMP domain-containing protein n=1 Tax=Campylobacter sp. RM9334 TaxID=2735732 RepID=UPI001D832019|nr:cache domain-containing protein [Campylobacter sp. RM9334]